MGKLSNKLHIAVYYLTIVLLFQMLRCAANKKSQILRRTRRNFDLEDLPDVCEFGSIVRLYTCSWNSPETASSHLRWRTGLGRSSYWIGGPRNDHTGSDRTGGYIFYETSQLARMALNERELEIEKGKALLFSPPFNHSGPAGLCLSFYYNIDGLSAKSLKVLLRNDKSQDTVLWESMDSKDGRWHIGEVAYSYGDRHRIILEAVVADQSQKRITYRGYVAVDDVKFDIMPSKDTCVGHCTFEGGFCDWVNMEEDDFDWELGRGSNSYLTGPPRDFRSTGKDEQTGGFAYINTAYPRRPGDTAMLRSPGFNPTGDNN